MTLQGIVFDIQRFSLHDGPGIRTTVFLKGCPLHCIWCHNPESRCRQPKLAYNTELCQHCGECVTVCQLGAHKIEAGHHIFSRENCSIDKCITDFACASVCVFGALNKTGVWHSVDEILEIVEKDKEFYRQSGGGLTLSGGEPLFQPEFSREILARAKGLEIHTVIETSGYVHQSFISSLLPLVDLWLYDYKATDPRQHKALTGVDNTLILKNLAYLMESNAQVRLRCPIIPGHNDTHEHLLGIVTLTQRFPFQGVEILPFHNTAVAKYIRYGLENSLNGLDSLNEYQKSEIMDKLKELGCDNAFLG